MDINEACKSLIEYIEKIKSIKSNTNETVFFRGSNYKYKKTLNTPSIYRKSKYIANEDNMIEEIISRKPDAFLHCNTAIEKLVMLQHYGLPTRLLDITRNPLTALFFSCIDNDKRNDGVVCRYTIPNDYLRYSTSDTVSILANLSFIKKKIFNIEKEVLDIFKEDGKYTSMCIDDTYFRGLNRELLYKIRLEKPYFEDRIKIAHLGYVVCVLPKFNNERIRAQQGAFLLFGIKDGRKDKCIDFNEKDNIHIKVDYIYIDKNSKKDILKELDTLGVNESVLFPELASIAKYIKEKY